MKAKTSTLIQDVARYVTQGLEEKLASYPEEGASLDRIGSAKELARRMLEVVPAPSRWDELLGPFYTTGQVARILGGISRQALADRRERRTLLGLKTADGVVLYPTFQFDGANRVVPGLADILQVFRSGAVDDWTLAGWLVSPSKALRGQSAIQWLRAGGGLDPALALARDAARRFAA